MTRGLQIDVLSFYGKKALKSTFFVHFFQNISGGTYLYKCRKGILPIFHAILFTENEIVHDPWLDKVDRDVARGMHPPPEF